MFKAMIIKELRECRGIALSALAAYGLCVWWQIAIDESTSGMASMSIPFIGSAIFTSMFVLISLALAIALGLRQTLGESSRGTFPLLLHRPATRRWLIAMKVAAGAGMCLACSAVPILVYASWAATPGNHPSPFFWSMTASTWEIWLTMALVYLGAFLTGLRRARWWFSRLWPIAAMLLFAIYVVNVASWPIHGLTEIGVAAALLIAAILGAAQTRDY